MHDDLDVHGPSGITTAALGRHAMDSPISVSPASLIAADKP
jgi:hypothetical protein